MILLPLVLALRPAHCTAGQGLSAQFATDAKRRVQLAWGLTRTGIRQGKAEVATIVTLVMVSVVPSRRRNGHDTHTTVTTAVLAESPPDTTLLPEMATGIRRPAATGERRNRLVSRVVCYSLVEVAADDDAEQHLRQRIGCGGARLE